jgi:hypothetical protein
MSQENVEIVRSYFVGTGGPLEGESRSTPAKEHFSALVARFW